MHLLFWILVIINLLLICHIINLKDEIRVYKKRPAPKASPQAIKPKRRAS